MTDDPQSTDDPEPLDPDPSGLPPAEGFIEQAPLAFFLLEENGEVLKVNHRACEQLEYERTKLLDQSVTTINPTIESSGDFRSRFDDLDPSQTREIESTLQTRTGQKLPVLIQAQKTQPDTDGYVQWWSRNLTDTQELEHELNKTRDRLRTVIEAAPLAIVGIDPRAMYRSGTRPRRSSSGGNAKRSLAKLCIPSRKTAGKNTKCSGTRP